MKSRGEHGAKNRNTGVLLLLEAVGLSEGPGTCDRVKGRKFLGLGNDSPFLPRSSIGFNGSLDFIDIGRGIILDCYVKHIYL